MDAVDGEVMGEADRRKQFMESAAPVPHPNDVVPQGDANVIRILQHFLSMATAGTLKGVVVVGIDEQGNVLGAPVVPQHPQALHIVNGALFGMMRQIDKLLDHFRQQQAASPIIKPNGAFRRQ
jgi:hypothetical protein